LIQVIIAKVQTTPNDPLEVPVGPITRLRAKKLKDTSIGLFIVFGSR
jgi:hypothetical protein